MKFRECAATVNPENCIKPSIPEPGNNMSIYTKKGDKGKTSLGSGIKKWKDDVRVETYGNIDELNSLLGVISSEINTKKTYGKYLNNIIIKIQDDLFSIGSYLSNPANSNLISHLAKNTSELEKKIDEMTEILPELSNFILPGGGKVGALLQLARTVGRRCERRLVSLSKKEKINIDVLQYMNRLSDLFFTMSRYANFNEKKKETIWKRR